MTCFFPLHAFKGKSREADKIKITFRRSESWRGERLDLPCGQCIGCRLERSRQWAVRCMHEASLYEKNCFLTLTYNDENLPRDGSLHMEDFQNFMKRLRKEYGSSKENPIRFYHCGEYGESNGRPHYHALLFNHDFGDRELFKSGGAEGKHRLFTSRALSRLWPLGYHAIGEVTFESAAYVARYVMKKVTGPHSEAFYGGRKPEYTTMSRRPGIGQGWFAKFKGDVYPRDGVVVRGVVTRPPRYYDGLLGREDPSTLALMKIGREKNGLRFVDDVLSDGRRVRVSDSSFGRLLVKEVCAKARLSLLKRPLEE